MNALIVVTNISTYQNQNIPTSSKASAKRVIELLLFAVVFFSSLTSFAQTKADTTAINETSLNYIEGFYTNNFKRVEKAVHPELAKRVITKDENENVMLKNMGSSELIFNAKNYKKPEDKTGQAFRATVIIFDISNDIATVKVTQNKMKFFDYLHLGKFNGEWKIVNVLWSRTN